MINELIERLSLDNEQISTELENSNSSNSINAILNKILSYEELTEEELNIFKNISLDNPDLTNEEKETLEFIEFLISVNECLEDLQINLLNKLLNKYKSEDTSLINTKFERNKRLIEALKSKDLFADYDYLMEVLKQYNYSNKDILIILKGLISSNYKDFDKSAINNEIEVSKKEDEVLEKNIFDVIDFENIKKILKKYGFRSNDFDKKYFEVLPIEDNMFRDMEYILEYFTKLSIKPKTLYREAPYDFIFTLAFGTKEHADEIERICNEKKIDLKELIKNGCVILNNDRTAIIDGSMEFFGLYDNFLKNIEFFDSLGYNHSKARYIEIFYMSNELCVNCYKLYTDEYRFRLKNPQDIDRIFSNCLGNCLDRTLELENGRDCMLENVSYLGATSKKSYYHIKNGKTKVANNTFEPKVMDALEDICSINPNYKLDVSSVEIPELEVTDYEKELYKYFEQLIDQEDIPFYTIPLEVLVDHSLEENEYIKYLDEKYKKGRFVYVINEETRVSRIKVLRILNVFNSKGIEINADTVKFAMKFDLIGYESDINNINNSLNDFQNERTKKLC